MINNICWTKNWTKWSKTYVTSLSKPLNSSKPWFSLKLTRSKVYWKSFLTNWFLWKVRPIWSLLCLRPSMWSKNSSFTRKLWIVGCIYNETGNTWCPFFVPKTSRKKCRLNSRNSKVWTKISRIRWKTSPDPQNYGILSIMRNSAWNSISTISNLKMFNGRVLD